MTKTSPVSKERPISKRCFAAPYCSVFEAWRIADRTKRSKSWWAGCRVVRICCKKKTYFVPLYELLTDFYAAIINDYLHIYSKCCRRLIVPDASRFTVRSRPTHGGDGEWWISTQRPKTASTIRFPPLLRQPMTPHRRGNVRPAAHRCTVELLDQGTDVIGVSCHKEVPGSPLLKR